MPVYLTSRSGGGWELRERDRQGPDRDKQILGVRGGVEG